MEYSTRPNANQQAWFINFYQGLSTWWLWRRRKNTSETGFFSPMTSVVGSITLLFAPSLVGFWANWLQTHVFIPTTALWHDSTTRHLPFKADGDKSCPAHATSSASTDTIESRVDQVLNQYSANTGTGLNYILCINQQYLGASLVAQLVKNLPARQEIPVRILGQEDPLEKGQVTHCTLPGLPC